MQRIRIGILGAGTATQWAILPALSGPDVLTPPDAGAWWRRRPSEAGAITYWPPARPEIVALSDFDAERLRRVSGAARISALYDDWRVMLREVEMDALLCPFDGWRGVGLSVAEIITEARARVRRLWIDGPPASSVAEARSLHQLAKRSATHLWCARPLRLAAAHRAAWSLLQEKQIGEISALSLRWGTPFCASSPMPPQAKASDQAAKEKQQRFASSYAALDLILGSGAVTSPASQTAIPLQTMASTQSDATSLWLRMGSEITATALFANADHWNSDLPRLEVCGTQGKSLICEAGRRLTLHQPGLAAHRMEPPGLSFHLSTAGTLGVAEDLKAFLADCAEESAPRLDLDDETEYSASRYSALWPDASRALQWSEAIEVALREKRSIEIAPLDTVAVQSPEEKKHSEDDMRNQTLPLQLL